ncbi:FtsX-like permease family protein [Alterisphingorhabdus coralli]|uniref:FtsX-like permease family protein n=1 Tax=Alterisphingorhabdus coralli TaxID=3071408 RepID=A0AA97F9D6_9SPHN|nr:FtsX-like permease family protein [Parasphingorhabdus sp. SCSIO 66989]WOE75698.1 FtsX-like permease family protein [Parasphingorhabdus sp. SCSIO 66989]
MTAMATSKASGTIWRWLLAGQFRSFPLRYLLASLAIALGIALGFSVHLINASASDAFGDAVRNISGSADAQIAGTTGLGFDEALYPEVFRLTETADVSPVIAMSAVIEPSRLRVRLLGTDIFRAAGITPLLLGRQEIAEDQSRGRGDADSGFDMDALYLSRTALNEAQLAIGDTVTLRANGQSHAFTIAGDLPGMETGQAVAVTDIATAQWRFDRLGQIDRLDIRRADGVTQAELNQALQAILPDNARITGAEQETANRAQLSRAYRVNLEMLALVALVTGGFLVYAAQSLSAETRQQQFALLRILGLQRASLQRQLLIEGLALGLFGSLVGLALGYGFALLVVNLVGADLGAGYFSGRSQPLAVSPWAIAVFLAFGIGTAIIGSLAPGRRAAKLVPAQAIKSSADNYHSDDAPRWWPGLLLLLLGGALTFAPPVNGLPLFGYLAIAALLAGAIWLTPWLAQTLLKPLTRLSAGYLPFDMALRHLMRSPSRAAAALAGIVASVGLMMAMAIMVSSFRTSVDGWLGSILSADVYVTGGFSGATFDADQQRRIAALPDIAHAEFSKTVSLSLDAERPAVNLIVRPVKGTRFPLALIRESGASTETLPIWVSEPAARLYDLEIGDTLTLPLGDDGAIATVVGIWSDYARQQGAIVIEAEDYVRLTGDTVRSDIAIMLAGNDAPEAVIARMRPEIEIITGSSVDISDASGIRALALQLFDRSFAITYGLEAVAILIGMVGVGATFAAQVTVRVKEFGMLRHIGFGRGQIIAMLASEGFLLGVIGLIAGLAVGLAISQVLIHVINPQSFNLTMTTHFPYALLIGISLALLATSALTAIFAGRRAASQDALQAVRQDW